MPYYLELQGQLILCAIGKSQPFFIFIFFKFCNALLSLCFLCLSLF